MNYTALLRSAMVALLRNKLRSLLTVLGISIGIAAVICVVAIGKAGQARVEQHLTTSVTISSGSKLVAVPSTVFAPVLTTQKLWSRPMPSRSKNQVSSRGIRKSSNCPVRKLPMWVPAKLPRTFVYQALRDDFAEWRIG